MLQSKLGAGMSVLLCLVLVLGVGLSVGMTPEPVKAASFFAKGADIGWLNQLEDNGVVWQDSGGVQKDALQILKDNGVNAVRLRVFVNPPSNFQWNGTYLGYGDKTGVLWMAQRAKNMGMRVMIDFHYSDHWADPGKQDKPSAWVNHSFSQLKTDVYNHTFDIMRGLADEGVYPDWVQVGNEIRGGLLWPDGDYNHFNNMAQLINSGYDAVKAVSPSSKVVVHLDKGADNSLYRWFFDNLTANGGKFDVIGMSYYPYWDGVDYTQNINDLAYNMNDMVSRYGKDVIICEVGGLESQPSNTYNMLNAVQSKLLAVPNGRGLGLFYWEPEANSGVLPDGYPLGATSKVSGNVLRFTSAIGAFAGSGGGGGATYVKLKNRASGLYIDGMGRTANGDNVGQWSNSSSYNQQWIIETVGSYVKIKNRASGLYIDGMGRTTNGDAAGQWSGGGSYNQQWQQETVGSYVKFRNRATGLYLDGMGRTANGSDLGQWSESSSSNQQWQIVSP
ncbi:MAG TPA: glycosyl hydrolase 53 family protein [Bacilli bacterium]